MRGKDSEIVSLIPPVITFMLLFSGICIKPMRKLHINLIYGVWRRYNRDLASETLFDVGAVRKV